jgi:hypothetical protein
MVNKLQTLVIAVGLLLLNLYASAQTSQSLSMGPGYSIDAFYKMSDGTVISVPANTWDIAFTTNLFAASNEAKGWELYIASDDVADWDDIDTTGQAWELLVNSDELWEEGAFNAQSSGGFNYGWGNYNPVNHGVTGSRIFIMKNLAGDVKKIVIDNMTSQGVYNFRIANLDDTGLITGSINKMSYSSKHYVYYDITTSTVVDREPAKADWDMVFMRYKTSVAPGQPPYLVTGVLTAPGVLVGQRTGVPSSDPGYSALTFQDNISEIGYDWKYFDMGTFTFLMEDSLAFFVQNTASEIYQMYFTSFAGSSTGNLTFMISNVLNVSTEELSKTDIIVFPNPATEYIKIKGEGEQSTYIVELVDMNGRVIRSAEINDQEKFSVAGVTSGTYFVRLIQAGTTTVQTLIIR